jgi:hypothetical protein
MNEDINRALAMPDIVERLNAAGAEDSGAARSASPSSCGPSATSTPGWSRTPASRSIPDLAPIDVYLVGSTP